MIGFNWRSGARRRAGPRIATVTAQIPAAVA